jgi:cation diffusion facilitator CzcD-associated flavoprotein CzcO
MSETSNLVTVAVIGAGFSGLCLGHHLREAGIDFEVFEKSDSLGGTWRDNSYPGAACDVPSISYCFSFAQKTDWSRKWSPQPEILEYMEECADSFGVRPYIRFGSEVVAASWDEARDVWTVRVRDGQSGSEREIEARFLVSGVGQLHRPQIPDIPGRDDFKGISFHSARWRHEVDLKGKTVAVVGNAASAIQFIPEIAKDVGELLIFQRSANWMVRRRDREYSDEEKQRFAKHPWLTKLYRWKTWLSYESQFPVFAGMKLPADIYERTAKRYLDETIHDPELRAALTPDYPIGAKRLLISDDYYDSLNRENVRVVSNDIDRFSEAGIVTADGAEFSADVVIFATGFATTEFLVPMKIEGAGGKTLDEVWANGAEAYLGITVTGFPNFFMTYGPNTNLGHNSIIFMIECQTNYILQCIRAVRERGMGRLDLVAGVMTAYNEKLQETLRSRVWAKVGRSWYKNAAGRITNNWSGSTIEYWWKTRALDLSKYRLDGKWAQATDGTSSSDANAAGTANGSSRTAA